MATAIRSSLPLPPPLLPLLLLCLLLPTRSQDWQAISGGGQWDADVERSTGEQCGVGTLDALSATPCGCTCAAAAPAGCIEDSAGMYARTGYNCSQVASGDVDYLHCNQLVRDITAEEAHRLWTSGALDLIIDVRSPTEYASQGDPTAHDACGHGWSDEWDGCEIGHIPGAYLVPLNPWNLSGLLGCSADPAKPVQEMTVATTCYNHASHPVRHPLPLVPPTAATAAAAAATAAASTAFAKVIRCTSVMRCCSCRCSAQSWLP